MANGYHLLSLRNNKGATEMSETWISDEHEFNMDELVRLIEQRGVKAYVEMTGGNCATIYIGDTLPKVECSCCDGEHYALVAGPGNFGWGKRPSTAYWDEFCYGPDDHGDEFNAVVHLNEPTSLEALADDMVSTYKHRLEIAS